MDPVTEMILGRDIEMFTESIPGAVLQAIFLLSGGWTTAVVVSIAISCLSTAFTATMLAYDIDTNAAKRSHEPENYGCGPRRVNDRHARLLGLRLGRYVPDSSGRRALIFILLFVYHGAHSLSKTYAMALLAQVSWLALIIYTVVDHVGARVENKLPPTTRVSRPQCRGPKGRSIRCEAARAAIRCGGSSCKLY
jgi:hypothetical protein